MEFRKRSNSKPFFAAHNAILTTILYADIFYFPLTKDELWRFLMSNKPVSKIDFEKTLRFDTSLPIIKKEGYYCLVGSENSIKKRQKNLREVQEKFTRAVTAAKVLCKISTIQAIGISGGLSAKNVVPDDDIDLFFIVKKNTLYLTRFWILLLLEFKHMRRKRKSSHTKNTICVNLLIDDSVLEWSKNQRNLYTAREIVQIVPLFQRNAMYNRFSKKNGWVSGYLPNALRVKKPIVLEEKQKKSFLHYVVTFLELTRSEGIFRYLQKLYMHPHKTIEYVSNHQLSLHPIDYKTKTLAQLRLKMRDLGLLTII